MKGTEGEGRKEGWREGWREGKGRVTNTYGRERERGRCAK